MIGLARWGVWAGCLLICSCVWAEDRQLTVIHSNDIYGQLIQRDGRGGMAARVEMIRSITRAGPALVLDAGDVLGPNGLSQLDQGATMIAAMRRANYAAMVPGNHDVSLGWDVLKLRGAEAGFPMLVANISRKDSGPPPLPGHVMVQVGDLSVGVLGVLGLGEKERIDPKHMIGFALTDPVKAADISAKALREQGAVCVIALVHMNEASALSFARQTTGVDLVVAGGFSNFDQIDRVPSLMQLHNGVAVVSTPGYGFYVGRVDLLLSESSDGRFQVKNVSTAQIPVDQSVPEDFETGRLVAQLKQRYDQVAKQPMGQVEAETLEAQGEVVAGLMRLHTHSEVGILNRGALNKVPSGKPLSGALVDQLIRFDNRLVKMTLTGTQLKALADQSQRASRAEARLVFSGFNVKGNVINRRPLQNDETYRVVVSDFLANGGDGYTIFTQGKDLAHTGVTLQGLVVAALQDTLRILRPNDFNSRGPEAIWRAKWGIEGAFNRNHVNQTTLAYRAQKEKVSFLSGETALTWNATLNLLLARDLGKQVFVLGQRLAIGQIGTTFGDLERSQDQIETDLTYHYRTTKFAADPFVSAGYSTTVGQTDGQRPKLVRGSTGFQRRFQNTVIVRLGARGQRDITSEETDLGFEVGLDFKKAFGGKREFRSRVRTFFGATDRRVVSVENYNTLMFPLAGSLSLSIRQNNFLYRVNRIGAVPIDGVANRWDLTLGLTYDLGRKWY